MAHFSKTAHKFMNGLDGNKEYRITAWINAKTPCNDTTGKYDFMSDERMDTIFDQVYTFVETNIRLGDSARNHSFNWLSEIKQTVENGRHRGYEIVIPEWLYSSVVNDKLVLTIDTGYLDIKGGLERWA